MPPKEPHVVHRLPWNSATTGDIMTAGRNRHHVQGLVEVDVTAARERLRAWRDRTGEALSTTGWLACCLGQALAEHPLLNVHRLGTRRMVQFRDVDVMVIVEREVDGERRGLPLVIRQADRKTAGQIHREIRAAQHETIGGTHMVVGDGTRRHWMARASWATRLYPRLPRWLRDLMWRRLARDAHTAKRILGTAGITAVGMFGRVPGWPLTVGMHTVDLAVGSIVRKPWVVGDRIAPREILALSVLVDHDLVDGAPAARFVARLAELLEQAHGLDAG
jgi:pyruvate/2-oxoglutarate dehydrogenase complex dihydrolipoamide acyltransferase (E2) component